MTDIPGREFTATISQLCNEFLGQIWNPTGEFQRSESNFTISLFQTLLAADQFNHRKLEQVFPDHAWITYTYQHREGGVEVLQHMAQLSSGTGPRCVRCHLRGGDVQEVIDPAGFLLCAACRRAYGKVPVPGGPPELAPG